ncbi:MAG: hypothetical protein ACLR1R_11950 [Ruminococcus callidus]
MKQYTIVGGINGVGKSSLSGVLRHQLPDMGVIIDPDSIAVQEHCDRLTAGKLAISKVNDCLKKGINFSQETTLSGRRTLRIIQQAREKDYHIRLYYVGVSSAEESLLGLKTVSGKVGMTSPCRMSADGTRSDLQTLPQLYHTVMKSASMTTRTAFRKLRFTRTGQCSP